MAALDLTNRAVVLAFLIDQLPDADPSVLETLLDASAGKTCDDPPVTTFRPFWILASQYRTRLNDIKRAKGASGSEVEYAGYEAGINGFLAQQHALDQSLCDIPPGFAAAPLGGARTVRAVRAYG